MQYSGKTKAKPRHRQSMCESQNLRRCGLGHAPMPAAWPGQKSRRHLQIARPIAVEHVGQLAELTRRQRDRRGIEDRRQLIRLHLRAPRCAAD